MRKKKYRKKIWITGIIVLGVFLLILAAKKIWALEFANENQMEEIGSILSENPLFQEETAASYANTNGANADVYAAGDHIVITQAEMDWKMEAYKILENPNPEKQAYEDLCKLKSEYYYATEQGYSCDDEELDEQIRIIKEMYRETDPDEEVSGLDEIRPMVEAAGGIDAYYDQMREITGKKMVISKFYDDQERAFRASLDDSMDWNEQQEAWQQKKAEISNKIVEEEHIQKVGES